MGSTCSTPNKNSVVRYRHGQKKYHHALLRGSKISKATLEERDAFGYSALHLCAFRNDTAMASRFVQHMESLELKEHCTDRTPLHVASWMQSVAMVKLLVENQANPNAVDDLQSTPLHLLFTNRRSYSAIKEIAYMLITSGANIYQPNAKGYTPLDYCVNNDYFDHCGSAIQSYVDAIGFLIAKNMTSSTLSSYDNAMEMIFLYKVLPYLTIENRMATFVKEIYFHNFLKPECEKMSLTVTQGLQEKAKNDAAEQNIRNNISTKLLKKNIMSHLNPALRSVMSLPALEKSTCNTTSCI